ncbi:hypothetical protein GS489_07170 [Rhodococcus hoagii]|nr:hypothetical protein [Prescottella equi]
MGDDSEDTLRAWADERGLSGRALRLGIVVPVGLLGVAGGFALLLPILVIGFSPDTVTIEPMETHFRAVRDDWTARVPARSHGHVRGSAPSRRPPSGSTARWLAATLPAGAAVATAVGVGVARILGFTTEPETFVAVIAAVCVVLAATAAVARYLATRPRAASEFSTAAA